MAVTIDHTLFTLIDDADAITNWTGRAPISNIGSTGGGVQAEGTACIDGRLQVGVGDATYDIDAGATDFTNDPMYIWFRPTAPVDTLANAGVTMRVSGTAGGASNYGQWNVGGSDLGLIGLGGWIMYTVDPLLAFNTSSGTIPAISAVTDAGIGGAFLSGPGMAQIVIDAFWIGTTDVIAGGTGGSPGLWEEAATADAAFGKIKSVSGAIFINCRVRFGTNGGTASSEFDDINGVVFFETNMKVQGDICGFEFIGNGTGTNNATFGVASGSGVDKIGGSGGVWTAAGDRPFRVEAKSSSMDAVGIFGVSMLGIPTLWDDSVRSFTQEDNSGGPSFLSFTREANTPAANDASPFPAGAGVNDAVYFGHNVRWYELNVNTGTSGAGTYTVTWEYFDGSTWSSLTDFTDGTGAFKTSGLQVVTFAIPDDWAATSINSETRFWIRARRDAGTVTTDPDITQASIAMAGDVELEDSGVEAIDCVFSGMGAIRIRNGAFLKRSNIASSLTPLKHAAVDLGGADPAADTVRDLTIINNTNGILLKGSGDVSYNFRNILFAGNTNDVRVDFGGGDTVTINILEGGSVPTILNVNSSTVNIVNAVTVSVQGLTEGAAAKVIANETVGTITIGDVLFELLADSNGVAEITDFNYEGAFDPSGLDVIVRARQQGLPNAAIADDGGAFTDETTESNSSTTDDMTIFPVSAVTGDAFYFGHAEQFIRLKVDVSSFLMGGPSAIFWDYWDGDSWEALPNFDDGGYSGWAVIGEFTFTWDLPGDWATTTINSQGPFYYIRTRLGAGGATTGPKGRKCKLDVTRYLPFVQNRTITSTGLTVFAAWTEDIIASF